ncbi:MAG TPA: ABC transporter ATP-binding protein [Patescibacteria group bacterium]|nr:ABC transporter ATP-binding protein [Patescibacteria group bacterium]
MSDTTSIAIQCNNVSKTYNLHKQKTFKEFIPALFSGKQTRHKFHALDVIQFSVKKGESIGIVGKNGSGKSTLLKLIAGVTQPTKGTIKINGRIAPLIELGAGFHPDLTGKENVFLNGSILGFKKKEMDTLYKHIVDFAELWEFMDQPIKFYSSGMYMRLAFSVAVAETPDILLLDEILAVGDVQFQKKCFLKIKEFQRKGTTILLVTHNTIQTEHYCQKALVLHSGKQIFFGPVKQAIETYAQSTE